MITSVDQPATNARFEPLPIALAHDSDRIDSLKLLSPAEEERVLIHWNETGVDYPRQSCLHHLFEQQVTRTPDAVAVSFQGQKLTYQELDGLSNQLARRLQAAGAGPEVLVGICVERSQYMVAVMLAVLKAGAAYVPLDPDHPWQRLSLMLRDSGIRLLVTDGRFFTLFPDFNGTVIKLDASDKQVKRNAGQPIETRVSSSNLAYVIYTSGSTGQPNGVMIEHRSVVNCLLSMQREPGVNSGDRMLAVTTLSFDIAALEIFVPLITGGEVIIASRQVATDGVALGRELSRSGATMMQATPSTWRMLLDSNWQGAPGFKALCGGEALSRELANELVARTGALWNLYGPTETTIWSLAHRVEDGNAPVLIGRPISNTRLYVLDGHRMPVPIGVRGELYIAGDGLGRGYWNRPELTNERFVELPFESGRAYKTGDIVRYRSDGRIEYLGRHDFQIKLRGHRIELVEIEAALRSLPNVKEAVVSGRGDDANKQLIAYLESDQTSSSLLPDVRRELKTKLPPYMLPSQYIVMERLPRTSNGKIDRKELPEPPSAARPENELVAPRNHLEHQLAGIWEEVIGIRPIGVTDNFFEIGGNSLLAVRLISRIETAMGHNLPVAELFESPTIELLAATIRKRSWDTAWSPVIELQPGDTDPFFCIHSLGGNIINYKILAKLCGRNQRFFGLQPYGLDGKHEPHTSIEEMARVYLAEIRRIQPKGPFRIGGVCLGGVVAFEMAQRLKAEGQEVSLLLLIDCEFPGIPKYLHIPSHWVSWVDDQIGELFRLHFTRKLPYLLGRVRNFFRWAFSKVYRRPPETPSSLMRATRRVMEVNLQALFRYVPRPYPGKITLFACTGRTCRSYADRRLAWDQVAGGGLEVHVVPGTHLSMLEHPNIEVMAGKLRECLNRSVQRQ